MKPLRIAFSAFGPFPGPHEVDFDRLGHHGLFLITGPTGAGKTTVLDAMVFALYGKGAGVRGKHTERLRSHYASASTPTKVEFEFEIGSKRYLIERSPSYDRPKQRGEGTVAEAESVRLSERSGSSWTAVGTKKKEVDAAVVELIGLDAEQFQQVILLPQGRFAEVLRADSKERLKLLRALFGTKRFEDAVEILRQESARRAEAAKDAGREIDRLFEDVLDDWCEVIAQAGDDAAAALGIEFDEGDNPYGPEEMDAAALEGLSTQADAMVAGLEAATKAANTAYDAAKKIADAAEDLADRWDRRASLLATRDRLAELAEADAARGPELDRAEAANDLVPLVEQAASSRAAEELARDGAASVAAEIAAATGSAAPGDAEGVAGLTDEQRGVEQAAREAIAQFEAAAQARKDERSADDAADGFDREREQLAAEIARVTAELPERRTAAQAAETAAAGIAAAEAEARAANDALTAVNEGITLDRQIEEAGARLAERAAASLAAREVLAATRHRHVSALAASLAADLSPGDACPTCGSTDHPHLATAPADAATADEVDAAQAALDAATAAESDIDRRRSALVATRETKPSAGEIGTANDRATAAARALDAVRDLASDADQRRAAVAAAEQFIAERNPTLVTLAEQAAEARARAGVARKTAEDGEERARAFAPDVTTAQARLAEASALIAALNRYDTLLHEAAKATVLHRGQREVLDAALAKKGFADEDAVTTAALDPEALATERAALAERDTERITVAANLEELGRQPIPDARPELDDLLEARGAAESARDEATEAFGSASSAAKRITDARARLGDRIEQEARAKAEADTAKTVYDVASGNAAPKIALESWVCSAYLERVTRQANLHLDAMTGGQYRMEIGRATDGRKQGGLDLDVFDLHTGASRSVDTLSGGETFMASMALALGLAEVVAGQQNLMLDALFIDEGFGSLDAETLDRATAVLNELQTAGRMVGVITHVTEMQKELPTGIAVTKTEQGSTLTVEYPDA